MAISARELLLIVRAQNQASGALRRVAKDIAGLSATQQLRMRGQQLRITEQNLRRQRQLASNELQSIESGRRNLALQKAQASARLTGMRAELAASGVEQQRLRNQEALLRNEVARSRISRQLNRLGAGTGAVPTGRVRDLQKLYDAAQIASQRLQREQGRIAERARVASGAITKQALSTQELAAREAEAARRAEYLRSRQAGLSQQIALTGAKIRDNNKALSAQRWDKVAAGGRVVQHLGRVAQYAGLVAGAGLVYAANGAAKFNTQATLVATQAGTVSGSFKEVANNARLIERGILQTMPRSTASMQELSDSAYEIFSSTNLGSQGAKGLAGGMKLLDMFSKAAIAGQTDLVKATEAGITVFNSFGKNINKMPNIMNRMFAAVRFGRFTFEQLSASMGQIAPAAVAANQSFDEVAGGIAFLSRHIPQVGMMRAAFARSLEMLNAPDFVKGLKDQGVAVRDVTGRMRPLNQVIGDIVRKYPELAKGTKSVADFYKEITAEGGGGAGRVGTIQGRRSLTFLLRFNEQYQKIRKQVLAANNSFSRSLIAMEQTTGVRWQKMVNQFKAFALMIGQAVIPQLLKLQPYIQKLIDWFNGLDKATRDKYGKWAAYSAGLLLVGSAFAFVSGLAIRLLATFGKMAGLLPTTLAIFIALAAAVSALRGDWDGLNGVIDTFVSYGTGSVAGWVTMLGLAAAAALKLKSALTGVAAANAAAGGAGLLGMVGGGRRAAGDFKAFKQVKMLEGSTRLAATMGAAAASIGAMGVSLPVVVGAIAAAAGGALLWKRHMDEVKRNAQEARNLMLQIQAPQVAAGRFGQLGGDILNFKQAQIDLKSTNLAITQLRTNMKSLHGVELQQAQLQLEGLYVQRARALQNLNTAYNNVRTSAGAFQDYIARETNAHVRLAQEYQTMNRLIRERAALPTKQLQQGMDSAIDASAEKIGKFAAEIQKAEVIARRGFSTMVTKMQQLNMLPAGITPGMRNMAFDFQKQLGRVLNPAQMKKFFTFALNINTAPANNVMANFIRTWRAKKLRIDAEIKLKQGGRLNQNEILALGRGPLKRKEIEVKTKLIKPDMRGFNALKNLTANVKAKPTAIPAAKKTLTGAFKAPITQQVKAAIPSPGQLAAMGAQISNGIKAGLHNVSQHVDIIKTTYQRELEIKSPSAWMAREVGVPISQGIIKGIIQDMPQLEKTAALSATLFAGTWLQKLEEKMSEYDPLKAAELQAKADAARIKAAKKGASELDKIRSQQAQKAAANARKVSVKDLIKDTQMQAKAMADFNRAIARLGKRGAPAGLLDDLRELGVEGLKYIMLLSNATPKELNKFIAAWNKMEREVKKSTYASKDAIKQWKDDVKKSIEEASRDAGQKLADMYNEFRDFAAGQFGALFSNIDPSTYGQGYVDAMASWTSNMEDLQGQMSDLNRELADLQAERAQIIADYNQEVIDIKADFIKQQVERLQTAFGELFGGEFLQARKEWAAALNFSDIQRDLDEQLARFKSWRQALADAANRGIPAGLLAQLEELGPEGLQMIQLLASGTDAELTKYISSWQEAQDMFQYVAEQQAATSDELAAQLADALTRFSEAMAHMGQRMSDVLGKINDVAKDMRKLMAEMPQMMNPQTILNSLQQQIDAWIHYQGVLDQLRARGVPAEIIAQLEQLGVEALPFLEQLVLMTDQQLLGPGGFVEKWTEAQRLIDEATHKHMQDQLQIWYRHGADVAAALIAGVASQQSALIGFFSSLFASLIRGQIPSYNPPTTGSYTGPGTTTGTTGGGVGPLDPWAQAAINSGNRSTMGTTVNMQVNAVQDESLMSTLETASFRLSNRNIP
jgi:TP901 family phage tail tape measure protein